jgi:hypothetical protein
MPRDVEIDRFKVRSEEGKDYTIIVYQEYIMDRNAADTSANIEGFKRLTTEEEFHIHTIDPDTYRIYETGEIVKRV